MRAFLRTTYDAAAPLARLGSRQPGEKPDDTACLRTHRVASRRSRSREKRRVRSLRENRRAMGAPAHLPDVRHDALLRFLAEPSRQQTRAATAPGHRLGGTRRALALLLPGRRVRGVPDLIRGASPLGLPYTLSRSPLRRLAPFAWLARGARVRLVGGLRRSVRSLRGQGQVRACRDPRITEAAVPGAPVVQTDLLADLGGALHVGAARRALVQLIPAIGRLLVGHGISGMRSSNESGRLRRIPR